jgi:hypothetical protein
MIVCFRDGWSYFPAHGDIMIGQEDLMRIWDWKHGQPIEEVKIRFNDQIVYLDFVPIDTTLPFIVLISTFSSEGEAKGMLRDYVDDYWKTLGRQTSSVATKDLDAWMTKGEMAQRYPPNHLRAYFGERMTLHNEERCFELQADKEDHDKSVNMIGKDGERVSDHAPDNSSWYT